MKRSCEMLVMRPEGLVQPWCKGFVWGRGHGCSEWGWEGRSCGLECTALDGRRPAWTSASVAAVAPRTGVPPGPQRQEQLWQPWQQPAPWEVASAG